MTEINIRIQWVPSFFVLSLMLNQMYFVYVRSRTSKKEEELQKNINNYADGVDPENDVQQWIQERMMRRDDVVNHDLGKWC